MNENKNTPVRADQGKVVEIDLFELFSYYMTKWPVVLAGLLIGAVVAGCYTFFLITPRYTATAKVYMVSSSTDSVVDLTDLNIGTNLSSDYAELVKVRPILEEIIKEKDLDYTYEQLDKMITLSTIPDTRILVIKVESTVPKEAKIIANALAVKAESEIPRLMDTAKPNIAEYAIVPKQKSSPSLTRNTLVGGLVGLLLVLGFYTLRFVMNDTVKTAEDVEKLMGVMPLTVIPESKIERPSDVSAEDDKDKDKDIDKDKDKDKDKD